jgi:SAM-dependent methyltransferase
LSEAPAGNDQLSVQDLAPLDQFHTRGLAATIKLAHLARIDTNDRVLDLGCGLGGAARYLAATYGCEVCGIDLSPDYVNAAVYLTERTSLSDLVSVSVGNVLDAPFGDASFDVVWTQHVAMNLVGRAQFYREAWRLLKDGGRFALFDVVARRGNVVYPLPWARTEDASFLLTASQTGDALTSIGFSIAEWHDDTALALEWFKQSRSKASEGGRPGLSAAVGPDFPQMVGNLGRNLQDGTLGILSAVLEKSATQPFNNSGNDDHAI